MGGLLWGVARRRKLRWIITLSIYGYSAAYSERGGTKPAPWILNIRYRDPVPVIACDQWGKLKPNARKKITIDIGVPVIQSWAVSRIHRNEKHVTHNYWYTDNNAIIQNVKSSNITFSKSCISSKFSLEQGKGRKFALKFFRKVKGPLYLESTICELVVSSKSSKIPMDEDTLTSLKGEFSGRK